MGRFADALAAPGLGGDRRDQAALALRGRPSARRRPRADRPRLRARGSGGDLGARRRALRRVLGRPPRGARRDRRPTPREGVLLDERTTCGRRRRPAPMPSCSCCATWTTTRSPALHGRGAHGSASTRSSRRTTPTRSSARSRSTHRWSASTRATSRRSRSTARRSSSFSAASRPTGSSSPSRASASRAQGAAAELAGADAILVGSALMRAPDPAAKLAELIARPLVKVCGLTRERGRRRRGRGGRGSARLRARARRARARPSASSPSRTTRSSVAVWVGDAGRSDADLDQVHTVEEGKVRGREATHLSARRAGRAPARPSVGRSRPGHWERAAAADGRIVLAGGLGPENVADAIAAVRPWAVDASSSLESSPGIKDHARVRAYVEAARA